VVHRLAEVAEQEVEVVHIVAQAEPVVQVKVGQVLTALVVMPAEVEADGQDMVVPHHMNIIQVLINMAYLEIPEMQ
jgi:hypothetical protein